jgi:hypothetical protein
MLLSRTSRREHNGVEVSSGHRWPRQPCLKIASKRLFEERIYGTVFPSAPLAASPFMLGVVFLTRVLRPALSEGAR